MAFATLMFIICLNIIPVTFAKTRQTHIIDFIFSNKNFDELFGITPQDTAYSLEIINYYNAYEVQDFLGIKYSVDKTALKENILDYIGQMFAYDLLNIYDLYYFLKSLSFITSLNSSVDEALRNKIFLYLNQSYREGGGFSLTNRSTYSNIVSTYFIFNIFKLMNEPILNQTIHESWILSCNNTDGGYGGNQTLSSTLLTTCYAIELIDYLGASLVNQTKSLEYLNSFYVSDVNNLENYGGFLPDSLAIRATLSSTFFGTYTIKMLNPTQLNSEAITRWVLGLQNFQDGGFAENIGANQQKESSIKATYYAFSTLSTLKALETLNEDVFLVEFNFIILIIVLSSIAFVIALIYFIWRKRRI